MSASGLFLSVFWLSCTDSGSDGHFEVPYLHWFKNYDTIAKNAKNNTNQSFFFNKIAKKQKQKYLFFVS